MIFFKKPYDARDDIIKRAASEILALKAKVHAQQLVIAKLQEHAQHLTSCPHSTVREIPNPPRVFLECSCGLGRERSEVD